MNKKTKYLQKQARNLMKRNRENLLTNMCSMAEQANTHGNTKQYLKL